MRSITTYGYSCAASISSLYGTCGCRSLIYACNYCLNLHGMTRMRMDVWYGTANETHESMRRTRHSAQRHFIG